MDPSAYSKSPLNYTGGKYRLLPQLAVFFPKRIHTLVDLFAGGCDVCSNIRADRVRANDINPYVIGIYQAFQKMEIEELLDYIHRTIEENRLSISSQEAYSRFRKKYNESPEKNPLDLYILVCYAFNYQFRFNSRHGFNSSFGRNRSSFNPSIRENLIRFHKRIREIEFSALDFREFPAEDLGRGDFVYADPPYLLTTGSYNDGKRGFKGWSGEDDRALFALLDRLDGRGVKFALSNVTEHKGLRNDGLIGWKKRYHTHRVSSDYKNSSYHGRNTDKGTREVLITNY